MSAIATDIPEGEIAVDSVAGRSLGFTSDRWDPGVEGWTASYLWRSGNEIICSLLTAREPGKGAFRELVAAIERAGFRIAVPTPLATMERILRHYGFAPTWEMTVINGDSVECEVWRRP